MRATVRHLVKASVKAVKGCLTEYNVKSTNLNQFFDQLVVSAGNNTTVLYFTYIKLQSADLTTNDAFCHNFTSAN